MKTKQILILILFTQITYSQIGIGTETPDPSSILDVTSSTRGILIPRMTETQRGDINTPAEGLMVYQTDATKGFYYYNGTHWSFVPKNGEFSSISGVVQPTTNYGSDDFVFGSTQLDDDVLTSDDDSRMLFDKSKGAFRVGTTDNDSWDNRGIASFSAGYNNRVTGKYSMALGENNQVTKNIAFAAGKDNVVSKGGAMALGVNNQATNFRAFVAGENNIASGNNSVAIGFNNQATANYAIAIGNTTVASGLDSKSIGLGTTAPSYGEIALGLYNTNYTPNDTVLFDSDDRLLVVGNGTSSIRKDALTILKNGRVGIGTSTPTKGLLEIQGTGEGQTINYGYLDSAGTTGTTTGGTNAYSIYADGRIAATEFHAYSDQRIKNILSRSNTEEDLNTLSKIKITNYKFVDTLAKGNTLQKKVIAQELNDVYPQAVTKNIKEFIPSIYTLSTIKDGWIPLTAEVAVGDIVKLIFSNKQEEVPVLAVTKKGFKVSSTNTGKVFVYGKEVDDFHSVDYEALSMLNISATQALLNKIERLENTNAILTEGLDETKRQNSNVIKRLEALEKIINIVDLAGNN